MTLRQVDNDVYDFIVEYKRQNDGISPSYREIRDAANISSSSMVKISLDKLVKAGKIELLADKHGGIKVVGGRWSLPSEDKPVYEVEL